MFAFVLYGIIFYNEAIISVYPYIDLSNITRDYLFKILPWCTESGDMKSAIKGKTLNSDSICKLLIPLPPLEEQKRIVEKIEILFRYISELKGAENE